jgi:hypothetical protein
MRKNFIYILQKIFPFLFTVALWRLSVPWLNPAGVLAIVPIYYCSFIKPVPYFTVFAILFCFLLDYKFDTLFVWTICYCVYYSVMNIQNFLDLTHTNKNGIFAFMLFFGLIVSFITIRHIDLSNLFAGILMFILTTVMYIPITVLIKAAQDD